MRAAIPSFSAFFAGAAGLLMALAHPAHATGATSARVTALPLGNMAGAPIPSLDLSAPHTLYDVKDIVAGRVWLDLVDGPDALDAAWLDKIAGYTGAEVVIERDALVGYVVLRLLDETGAPLSKKDTEAAMGTLRGLPGVTGAWPDLWMQALAQPTDNYYPIQWGLHPNYMNAEGAWDITQGSPQTIIAVADSGVDAAHPEFAGRLIGGYDFVSGALDPYTNTQAPTTGDGDGRDSDATPSYGVQCPVAGTTDPDHGNHVAGIAAGNQNGQGTVGVDWNAKILPVRVLGPCGGSTLDIFEGLLWAAGIGVQGMPPNPNAADVINLSVGLAGAQCIPNIQAVVDNLTAAGVPLLAASGNDGGAINVPANCGGAIAVGAYNLGGAITSYTSATGNLHILGPGGEPDPNLGDENYTEIASAVGQEYYQGHFNDIGPYFFKYGTSMATPAVAGLVGLMKTQHPTATPAQLLGFMQSTGLTVQGTNVKAADAQAAVVAARNAYQGGGGSTDAGNPGGGGTDAGNPGGGGTLPEGTQAIQCGQTVQGATGPAEELKFYALTNIAGAPLTVALTGTTSADYDLFYGVPPFDQSSILGYSTTENSSTENLSVPSPPSGTVLVLVDNYAGRNNAGTGSFSMTVHCNGTSGGSTGTPDAGTGGPGTGSDAGTGPGTGGPGTGGPGTGGPGTGVDAGPAVPGGPSVRSGCTQSSAPDLAVLGALFAMFGLAHRRRRG